MKPSPHAATAFFTSASTACASPCAYVVSVTYVSGAPWDSESKDRVRSACGSPSGSWFSARASGVQAGLSAVISDEDVARAN